MPLILAQQGNTVFDQSPMAVSCSKRSGDEEKTGKSVKGFKSVSVSSALEVVRMLSFKP